MLAVGVVVGVLSYTFVAATPVSAVDGEWNDQAIVYGGESYQPVRDTGEMARKLGLPQGTRIYAIESQSGDTTTIKTVYFEPGTDIGQANTAKTATFTIDKQKQVQKTGDGQISLTPAGESVDGWTGECGVEHIGWIVCPFTNSLAWAMDTIYSGLMNFLDARQLNITNDNSGIYIAWSIMLGFANIAFIAGFLVLIYSYLTSTGVSNYGIKRMLPRLMIAAILVNLSFYICAIAIDLSNISGRAIQDMFIEIRNTVANTAEAGTERSAVATWAEVTALVLAGGAGTVAGGVYLLSNLPWLVPALLSVGLALLVVVIVLAARQALIVILTIISPLAFVAYILPGTEKWFEKWRDLFFTMLIFFPAFSAVFGGSQLAGLAIVQNADSIVMTILGLTVQMAPLAIAPLIMKLSGGLLNRLAGVVNNPQRGLIDKSKQWAAKKSEQRLNNKLYGENGHKKLKRSEVSKRFARWMQRANTQLDDELENSREAAYVGRRDHDKYREFDKRRRITGLSKQAFDKELERSWHDYAMSSSKALEAELKLRVTTDKAAERAAALDNIYEEMKAGGRPARGLMTQTMSQLRDEAMVTSQHLAAEGLRKANAQRAINQQNAEAMLSDKSLQTIAAGNVYQQGQNAALASAINTMRSDYSKAVEEGGAIVKHFNLSSEQRQKHGLGEAVAATDSYGNTYTFDKTSVFTREYAVDFQVRNGTVDEVSAFVQRSGSSLSEFKTTIAEALVSSAAKAKAPWLGGKTIDDVGRGVIGSEVDLMRTAQEWIAGGKFKPEDVAGIDPQGFDWLRKALGTSISLVAKPGESPVDFAARQLKHDTNLAKYKASLRSMAGKILEDDILQARIVDGSRPSLEDLRDGKF